MDTPFGWSVYFYLTPNALSILGFIKQTKKAAMIGMLAGVVIFGEDVRVLLVHLGWTFIGSEGRRILG